MLAPVDFDGDVWVPVGYSDDGGRALYRNRDDVATAEEINMEYGIHSWSSLTRTLFR